MADTAKEYRRLPGLGKSLANYTRLWQGRDHLLLVLTTGYSEDYKRFYYADIQAILVRKTIAGKVWNLIWGVLAGVFALLAFAAPDADGRIILGIFAGFFLFVFFLNWLIGPTCVCHLRTAIQTEQLGSLHRLRTAREVINRIKPLIETAQGQLDPEGIQSQIAALAQRPPSPLDSGAPPILSAKEPRRHYHGRAHLILFWLLLADGPSTVADVLSPRGWILPLSGLLLILATLLSAILALVKQHGSDLPKTLKRIPWIVLGFLSAFFLVSVGYGVVLAVRNSDIDPSKLSPLENPVFLALSLISMLFSVVLGSVGLISLNKFRRTQAAPPALPSGAPGEPGDPTGA